jgi:hypothetical protein
MPFEGGPYVTAAALCDRTLQESDGVLSLIRIVDKVTVAGVGPEEQMAQASVNLTLVLILKAGDAAGRPFTVKLRPENPEGRAIAETQVPVRFADEPNASASLLVQLGLLINQPGLYWINVLLDDELLTRVPLLVQYAVTADLQAPAPG